FENCSFRKFFGLSKSLTKLLIEDLAPYETPADRNTKIPLALKVLVALNFYCSGSYQKRLGQDFLTCLSQASVSRIITQISRLIAEKLLNKYVTFPTTMAEVERVKTRFQEKYGIRGVIGVVDGTHIRLSGLNHLTAHSFLGRKRYHSLNVMMVCDADCFITSVNANFPGSVHDSHIWRMSTLSTYLERKYNSFESETFLLGKYSLNFNFGILKNRFRCLNGKERALRYNPQKASYIVVACCVLHNLCIIAELPRENENENDCEIRDISNNERTVDLINAGRIVQRRIINMMNPVP
ncbi:putative nuclease HARBI1, partial [Phlebotomus papatasi]|uniref:putative nuclease HARBI1 n=1 Tax=Phlebotomus papatasi TaxID=29031 RepID=UPI002483B408